MRPPRGADPQHPGPRVTLAEGSEALVATVFDLFLPQLRARRGLGGDWVSKDFNDDSPYTPAWAEKITGVDREKIIAVAREFAGNAEKTPRQSPWSSSGPVWNHWYHMDMNYRGISQHAGDVGWLHRSGGGGWSQLTSGQEKLAPADRLGPSGLRAGLGTVRPCQNELSLVCWYCSLLISWPPLCRTLSRGRDPVVRLAPRRAIADIFL